MSYNVPPVSSVPGLPGVDSALLGTPTLIGVPTSYVASVIGGRLILEVLAAGGAAGRVLVPVPSALASDGILARVSGLAWSNTAGSYAGVYAKSAAGLVSAIYTSGTFAAPQGSSWVWERAPVGWATSTVIYNQLSQSWGNSALGIQKSGTTLNYTSGLAAFAVQTEVVGAYLLDVAEYGVWLAAAPGTWSHVEFDLIQDGNP